MIELAAARAQAEATPIVDDLFNSIPRAQERLVAATFAHFGGGKIPSGWRLHAWLQHHCSDAYAIRVYRLYDAKDPEEVGYWSSNPPEHAPTDPEQMGAYLRRVEAHRDRAHEALQNEDDDVVGYQVVVLYARLVYTFAIPRHSGGAVKAHSLDTLGALPRHFD